ncbi:probable helicase senataxin [Impatiens glandulifera]|uniref:probable helicase senataxin n=1 Tax=Impatiens glandulifera TaxID=253017 RepID=UPI001FB0C9C8|nr:probable helicase senataxin [Impatiens glandulifera]
MNMDEKFLIDLVFSWSISDICNQNLYKAEVYLILFGFICTVIEIPKTFSSVKEYLDSFKMPLIEEMHADLSSSIKTLSNVPVRRIFSIEKKSNKEKKREKKKARRESFVKEEEEEQESKQNIYDILYPNGSEILEEDKKYVLYEPKVGDLFAITEVYPNFINDLSGRKMPFTLGLVQHKAPNHMPNCISILASNIINLDRIHYNSLFVVYLTNMNTNMRIWSSLHTSNTERQKILKNVLHIDPSSSDHCNSCCSDFEEKQSNSIPLARILLNSFDLDDSQKAAVLECIARRDCQYSNSVKLIWGPPGTGKTKTVASLLYVLQRLKCRTLTCAPTNIAVVGVASRLMDLFRDELPLDAYRLGDIVLFGNFEKMKIRDHDELFHVFLDNRVLVLSRCLDPRTGWVGSARSFINLVEDPQEAYRRHLATRQKKIEDNKLNMKTGKDVFVSTMKEVHSMIRERILLMKKKRWQFMRKELYYYNDVQAMPFEEFFVKQFNSIRNSLIMHIVSLYTHYPTSLITSDTVEKMIRLVELLSSIQDQDLRKEANFLVMECVEILKNLQELKLLKGVSVKSLRGLCMKNAVLLFCTASSSCNLQSQENMPLELLVVDEAAQLKECESTIPLQLIGLKHAILIGDDKQLPAMVQSEISNKAKMGRSLFERMVILGMPKHLLNIQYRMHPSISLFPNKQFYQAKLLNGPNVIKRQYEKHFLEGPMFGSYSFIDIRDGKEDFGGHSSKNMVEVAVVAEIVERLHKASVASKQKISIGCISPYKAQVIAIQNRLEIWYDNYRNFSVKVRSVDDFQGGEEDLIIISTVRCNVKGSIGFLSNCQRANVALTRARYGMWILGNAATLINSGSIWRNLIVDAKERGCYFNALDNNNLSNAIQSSLIELDNLNLLFKSDSPLFQGGKWKVHFSDDFLQTMSRKNNYGHCKEVISLLKRLSTGWRLPSPNPNINGTCNSEFLEMYNVNKGSLVLVWSVNVIRKDSRFIQVMQVWDVLAPHKIPDLAKKLEVGVFRNYTVGMMSRCKTLRKDGELVVPATWLANSSAADSKISSPLVHEDISEIPHRLKNEKTLILSPSKNRFNKRMRFQPYSKG